MILGNEGSVEKKIGEQILFKAKLVLHGGLTITDMNCELMICMQKHGQLAKDAPMAPNSLANHLGNFQVKLIFHIFPPIFQRISLMEIHLPSNVVFHQKLSFLKDGLPLKPFKKCHKCANLGSFTHTFSVQP